MRAGGGKQKGASFEREICARLSLWVTRGRKKDCFWRSAMSGGRATVHVKRGDKLRQSGDITAVAPEGHALTDTWFIECKHLKSLEVMAFLLGRGILMQFWRKACIEADTHDKRPMLIAKQNLMPILLIVNDAADDTAGYFGKPIFSVNFKHPDAFDAHAYLFDDVVNVGKRERVRVN